MSPLVSCAQAPPAKGHDGLWGREWVKSRLTVGSRLAAPHNDHNEPYIDETHKSSGKRGRGESLSADNVQPISPLPSFVSRECACAMNDLLRYYRSLNDNNNYSLSFINGGMRMIPPFMSLHPLMTKWQKN